MSVLDELLAANAHHRRNPAATGPRQPARKLAVVTCMDARLDLFDGLGLTVGDAHFVRNAGGQITEDVLRSLVISQRLIGTRAVAVIHHTECGMSGMDDAGWRAELAAETGAPPPWDVPGFVDLDGDVIASVRAVRECPWLPHRDDVRGFVYDVSTDALREVPAPA